MKKEITIVVEAQDPHDVQTIIESALSVAREEAGLIPGASVHEKNRFEATTL